MNSSRYKPFTALKGCSRRWALAGLGAFLLSACGKKASLRPPDDAGNSYSYPRPYPDPKTVVPDSEAIAPKESEADDTSLSPLPNSRTTTTSY
jgi:hypothetical protein